MESVSYRSQRVSSFQSSRSTFTKNCLIPRISQKVFVDNSTRQFYLFNKLWAFIKISTSEYLLNVHRETSYLPSRVSSSFLTKMRIGLRMKHLLTTNTSSGIVAESRITWSKVINSVSLKLTTKDRNYTLKKINYLHIGTAKSFEDVVDLLSETTRQHFVGFIQHEDFNVIRSYWYQKI